MIIGPKKLLQLVKKNKLVKDLSDRELKNPEGAGFDLRLGEVYKISGKAFLGETHRETPKVTLKAKYSAFAKATADKQKSKRNSITIKPGDFYLVTTIESVNLPKDIVATFIPRTTTFRSGLFLRTGVAQPGYQGKLTFGLKNEGPVTVTMELGCRFVHVRFEWVDGGGSMYRGQWQGGRVTTKKRERQI
jgi:deoxycytidine triphosphate deaminase